MKRRQFLTTLGMATGAAVVASHLPGAASHLPLAVPAELDSEREGSCIATVVTYNIITSDIIIRRYVCVLS